MTAYYNENDAGAAAWLRELISAGQIAPGDVDERSIVEVQPSDLRGYAQCHFFAGIGGWSYALRLAGIADDEAIWTGSCPCQPLSCAGQRKGHADERHLWPAFYRLIAECRPATVFGEQVASKDGREWLAGVRADLEALGYAVGGADLCAAGVGVPHIRQRLYWMADANGGERQRITNGEGRERDGQAAGRIKGDGFAQSGGEAIGLADADGRIASDGNLQRSGQHGQQPQDGGAGGVGNTERDAAELGRSAIQPREGDETPSPRAPTEFGRRSDLGRMGNPSRDGRQITVSEPSVARETRQEGNTSQRSSDLAWSRSTIRCLDGKSRRVEPGIFPLVDGLPRGMVPSGDPGSPDYANATGEARTMRLRGYGNAIHPALAAEFIRCAVEADPAALKQQRGET